MQLTKKEKKKKLKERSVSHHLQKYLKTLMLNFSQKSSRKKILIIINFVCLSLFSHQVTWAVVLFPCIRNDFKIKQQTDSEWIHNPHVYTHKHISSFFPSYLFLIKSWVQALVILTKKKKRFKTRIQLYVSVDLIINCLFLYFCSHLNNVLYYVLPCAIF